MLLGAAWQSLDASEADKSVQQLLSIDGSIELIGNRVFLKSADQSHLLLLLPKAALDSLGLALEEGEVVKVEGDWIDRTFLVYSINRTDTIIHLRDAGGIPVIQVKGGVNVVPSRCIGCRLCVKQCPVGAISFVQRKAVIDQDKCIECYICVEGKPSGFKGCPVGAIKSD